ncbi:MAG TPA: hypothetical protein VL688_12880, partial [Verrucomicrobiae bacterium]|nr:hypothetical protein [Verrucomicrobiae bacterium]
MTFFLIAGDVCKFAEASPAAEPSSSSRVPVPSGKSLRDFFEAPGASLHGTLEETYDGAGGAPFVLILKDAHGSGDAQKSLAGLITRLSAEYDFPLVALEGADGPLDLTLFRAYPEPSQAKALFEDLAGRGEISGAALAAVQAPETTAFYGVEDAALYRQSVQAFLDGLKPSGFEKELAGIQKDLQAEKEKNYGPLLLELDRRREKLRDPANSLEPLFHFFEQLPASFRLRNFSDRYPRLLLVASELEKTGEDRKIQLLTRVFEKRVKRLLAGRGTLREFHALKQKYQTGQMSDAEYAEQLARLDSEKTALPQALAASVQRSRELRALKGEEFWRELNAYLDALMNALAVTEKEKTLRNLSAQARRLEDLIHFRLSRSDWNAVAAWAEPSGISGLAQRVRDFSNETLSDRRPFALFYRLAEKRDGVFAEKIQARMTEARAKAAIFVTGGFHAESLARLLKERGYSYAVVSPAVQEIPDDRVYLDCMRGRVSWSRYFQVRSGALDVYDAFLRAGTERLMRAGHFPAGQKLKSWRDAVLKKLAREGRLDRAASYTAILDAYAAKSSDDPGTRALEQAWMERVAAFVQNLKGLERRGTLTPEKIMGLTSAVSTNHWPAVMSFVPGSRVPAAWLDLERNPVESVRAELRTDEFDFSNLSEVRKKIGDFEIRLKDADAEHLPAVMAELVAFQNDFYAHWKTKDRSRVEGLLEEMSGLHAAARKRLEPLAPAPRFASELVTMRTLDENVLTPPDRYPPDDMDLLLPNEALGSVRQWTAEQLHERDPGAEFHPVTGQVIKGGGFSQIFLMDRVQDGETTRLAVEIPRFADIPPFSFPPAGSPGSLAGTVARNGENFRAFHEAGRTRFVPKPFELLTYPLGRRGRGVGALPVSVHEYFAGTEELSPAFGSLRRWVIDPGTRESRFEALTPAEAGDVLSEIAAIMTYHYDPLKAGGTTISEVRLGNGDVVIPAAGPEGLRRNADGSLGLKLITARDLRTRISIPEFIRSLIQMQANEQMAEDRDKIDPAQSEVIALSLPALFSNPAIAFEGLRRGLYYLALDTEGLAPEAAREKASRTALDWISQFEASSFGKPYAPFLRAWREHGGFSQGTPVFGTEPGEGHPIRGNFTHLRNQLLDSFSADGTPEGISDGPASRSYAFLDRREALIPERPELRSEELSPKDTARLSALLETHESIFGKSADVVALGPARADIGAHVDYPTFPSDGSAQNYSLVFAL